VKCRTCDQDNPPEASFCANCGATLVAGVELPSPSAPSPPQVPRKWLLVGGVIAVLAILLVWWLSPKAMFPDKLLENAIRREYNQVRPHSALGYRPPAPEARIPVTLT